jgi:hypothetical protein
MPRCIEEATTSTCDCTFKSVTISSLIKSVVSDKHYYLSRRAGRLLDVCVRPRSTFCYSSATFSSSDEPKYS